MTTTIFIIIGALLLIYIIFIYNRFVRLQNMVNEAWSGIDVQLQKRHDLIPNIVKTVQEYARHEKSLLEKITQLRNEGIAANNPQLLENKEINLSIELQKLWVVVENYPELKANENFLELQQELSKVENDLQKARRYYNGSVRNFNILLEQFPSNLIGKILNFKEKDFFDLKNESEKAAPKVELP